MIQKLPFEIILTISDYLDFTNKLTLMTTCQSLHDLIANTSLYSDLNLLLKDKQTVDCILQKFDSGKLNGAQVKQLWLDGSKIAEHFYVKLSALFPNVTRLRKFKGYFSFSVVDGKSHYGPPGPMVDWANTIETHIAGVDDSGLLSTLETTILPRLTELSLDLACDCVGKARGFDFFFFLKKIKNAPALRKLALNNCAISLSLLEEIHSSCPYIESLDLNQTVIVIREGALPQSMLPANSVVQLKISQSLIFDRNGLLLDYITRKYRDLYTLVLDFRPKYHLKQLRFYLKSAFELYHNDTDSDQEEEEELQNQEIQHLYDSLEQDFNLVSQVYQSKETAFFSSLPKTLKCLELGTPFTGHVLKELVKANIKPVALHLLRPTELRPIKLKDLDQLVSIRDMKTLKSLKIAIDPRVQAHHLDYVSTTVTKLYIRFENHPFYMDWVMAMFPSVEELRVDCPSYSSVIQLVNRDAWKPNPKAIYPNLLVLKTTFSPIDQKLLAFCKSAAPNIEKLDLTIDFPSKEKTVNIDLMEWQVRQCCLNLPGFSHYEKEYFIVNVTIQDVTKRCVFQSLHGNMTLTDGTIKPKIERVVNMVCDDDQHIVIGGFTLMKTGHKIVVDI